MRSNPLEPFSVLARASLTLGTLGGFSLGLLLLLPVAFRLPLELPWLQLVQVHGQVQILGFAALFIFAVGTIIFPRFLGVPNWDARRAQLGGLLLAVGVTLRALSQPFEPSAARSVMLLASGLLELLGPLLFASALAQTCRASVQPFAIWHFALGFGFGSLLLSLLLNLGAVWRLAVDGLTLVPPAIDEAIIHLQLRGFVVGVTLAVALKVFPQFLLLRPPRASAIVALLPGYAVGLALGVLSWLLLEIVPALRPQAATLRATADFLMLLALIGFVVALRLYEPPVRESGRPHVTDPTRLWFRLAFGWLLVAALLQAWLSTREALDLGVASFTERSAARHALTMGFLMVLLFGMATRILPGYSGWALRHPAFLNATVATLFVGAALRVGGELAGGYGGVFGPLTGLGGILGTLGFLLFAATLWPALGHLPVSTLPMAPDSGCAANCHHSA